MITLRPYQVKTVSLVHDALRRHRRVICCSPTGTGKRFLATWWCDLAAAKGRKVIVVTNRRLLVEQMAAECQAHGVPYGIVMGDTPRNDSAAVQIASIQTLKIRKWRDMPEANLLIVDEAHQQSAAYAELFDRHPEAKAIGFTATPVGAKGYSLIGTWDEIVEPVKNSEAIREGWLLPTQVWSPSEPDCAGVSIEKGEYVQSQLGQAVEQCTVFADVFRWWGKYSDLQTICFAPLVKYAYGLAEQFRERGHSAEVIEGGTKRDDRRDIFARFADRELRVLVSVDVLREGFDAPAAQCGVDLQPNKQLRTYWQKVGRVKRPHEGQEHAVWLDFAGNFWRFPHPDEDPQWLTTTSAESIQDRVAKDREQAEKQPWSCPQCSYSLASWQRIHGGTCPNCGAKLGKPIRRIRMKDGQLRSVSATEKKKVQASHEQQVWDRCRYKAYYCRKTLDFARWLYKQETGHWPPVGLKSMPETTDSGDWKRKVAEVYPWMQRRRG
jgi:superfamily II DNA or RNA helicase